MKPDVVGRSNVQRSRSHGLSRRRAAASFAPVGESIRTEAEQVHSMVILILLGAAAGFFVQPLYYGYVFAPYPFARLAFVSAVLPLALAFFVACVVALVGKTFAALFRLRRDPAGRCIHALSASLFLSIFLHIEGIKIANELGLAYVAFPPTLGLVAGLLAWCWLRYRRYAGLLREITAASTATRRAEIAALARDTLAMRTPPPSARMARRSADSTPRPAEPHLAAAVMTRPHFSTAPRLP
jgi:hypothetical protein